MKEVLALGGDKSEEDLRALETRFALAGRLMRLSNFGKAAFFHIQDRTGRPKKSLTPGPDFGRIFV